MDNAWKAVLGSVSLIVFSILILAGGIFGYKKAKSKMSLITSVLSSAILMYCYWLSTQAMSYSTIALILTTVLDIVFLTRWIKTKKFMPSGMLLLLSILEQIIIFYTTMS